MADHNMLMHPFVSPVADAPDPTHQLVHPSDWNHQHVMNPALGANGYYLMRDSTYTDNMVWDNLWSRLGTGVIDVTKPPYNVPGNGVTDAAVALSSMLNALGSAGALLYFPPGIYTSSGTLLSLNDSNRHLTFLGAGEATILQSTGTGATVVNLAGTSAQHDLVFQNLLVDGASTAGNGMAFTNAKRVRIRDCRVQNCTGNGISFAGAQTSDVEIATTWIASSASMLAGAGAIILSGGQHFTLRGCIFPASNYQSALRCLGAQDLGAHGNFFGAATWTNDTINLSSPIRYTEVGHVYDTSAGYTGWLWNWLVDAPCTILAPLTTSALDLRTKLNTSGRDQRLLTFIGNPGAPTAPTTSQIPALQSTSGLGTQTMPLYGTLSSQFSGTGTPNSAGTGYTVAAAFTVPANTWARDGYTLRCDFSGHASASGNQIAFQAAFVGTTSLSTPTFNAVGQSLGFSVFYTRVDATHILAYGSWSNGSQIAAFRMPNTGVGNLATTTIYLAVNIGSPVSGAAGDIFMDAFRVAFVG